jgi:thymidylate synthase
MPKAHFEAETLDDAMAVIFREILENGDTARPTKGANREITGILLEVTNPRARLSLTETRSRLFSAIGEFCWYLAGASDLEFIEYYLSRYADFAEDGTIFGAYGPRLFHWRNTNQLKNVTRILREGPDSRRAVIQLFDAEDIIVRHKDVPCTCTLQFLVRGDRLNLVTYMRSNDAFIGLPHDFFCFTMLQEIVARELGIELGTYKHMVGSLHIYEHDLIKAEQFINEGFQSTEVRMPPMPVGDPWAGVSFLLAAEGQIRMTGRWDDDKLNETDPYWVDLVRLLQVFRCKKSNDLAGMTALRSQVNKAYWPFINMTQ